jgi:hypothetical protein
MNFKSIKLLTATACMLIAMAGPALAAQTAKISDFKLIHPETTIKAHSSYAKLNALSDDELKKTVMSPAQSDYITVKAGTMDLRDGNTRVYILKQRGFGTLVVPYDEIDTSVKYYDF